MHSLDSGSPLISLPTIPDSPHQQTVDRRHPNVHTPPINTSTSKIDQARTVIALEIRELERLRDRLDEPFSRAVDLLQAALENRRKIVVVGIGKSGNIGHKIAATLNSTGATAVVLHSQNTLHGDLGLLNDGDAVLILSYGGETAEVLDLLPHLRRSARGIIAMTGAPASTLARNSDIVLDTQVEREACPLNLAPTSSSTAMLVLGDALAMVLLESRGIGTDDFAALHPGGSIGRALLTKVSHIMRTGDRLALVAPDAPVRHALQAMSQARAGAAVIADADSRLVGIFTQGDFARAFQLHDAVGSHPVRDFMTPDPVSITADRLAAEVLKLLETHPVDDLVVTDDDNRVLGLVDTQDLSRAHIL
ncbi:KpsF/GutQ family sugar-phosphate isomerase [soil metagenome]